MAGRTITQRIALDGGKELESQLQALGAAAQAAFDRFAGVGAANTALGKLGTSVDGVVKKINDLKEAGSGVGTSLGGLGSSLVNVGTNLAKIGGAASLAVVGIGALFKSSGEAAENLQNLADSLGISAEKLSNLKNAAELSGFEGKQFETVLRKLAAAMGDASKQSEDFTKARQKLGRDLSTGKITFTEYTAKIQELNQSQRDAGNVFKDLGVNIKNVDGSLRDVDDVMKDVADAFKALPDGVDKANKSMTLFGSKNVKFAAFMNLGADGINDMTLAAQRIAPALDKAGRASLDRVDDSITQLGKASVATRDQILAVFAPDVARLVEAYTETIVNARAAWVNYAKTIQAQVKPIVDDIVTLLQGRNADVKNGFILKARDAVLEFGLAAKNAIINIVIPAFQGLLAILQTVADGINAAFGTQLTGGQLAIALTVTKLIGLFGVLSSSIGVVVSVVQLLATAFGSVTLAAVAVAAAVAFLIVKGAQSLGSFEQVVNRVFGGIPIVAKAAFDLVAGIVQTVVTGIGTAFSTVATVIADAVGGIVTFFTDAWQMISQGAADLMTTLLTSFKSGLDTVAGYFTSLLATVKEVFKSIMAGAAAAASALGFGGGDGGGGAPGFAGGGHVRGPGSGTSDSIPAWLSNGEFVARASSVRKYGVNFMDALNRGLISVSRVRDLMSGVNLGSVMENMTTGLMPRTAFATGGLAVAGGGSGMHPVTVNFNGNSYEMAAAPDVVRQLQSVSSQQQIRSAARKPTWYRG